MRRKIAEELGVGAKDERLAGSSRVRESVVNFVFGVVALVLLGQGMVREAEAQAFTERNPDQDFNTLGVAGGNKSPQGIFAVDGIMLVSDVNGRIYSYDLASKERQDSPHNDVIDLAEAAVKKSKRGGENTNADDFILYKDGSTSATNTPNEALRPFGLWATNSTLWVAHKPLGEISSSNAPALYAYSMMWRTNGTKRYLKGTRDKSLEFTNLFSNENWHPTGIWSDGETMWVADQTDNKLYAYHAFSKFASENTNQKFDNLASGNTDIQGIWSDGETMWAADDDNTLYAYNLATKERDSSKESTLNDIDPFKSYIWSNGTTMWITHFKWSGEKKLYAFKMEDMSRDSSKDIDPLEDAADPGGAPTGVWSDRETIWVADRNDDKIYAYNMWTTNSKQRENPTLTAKTD